MLTTLLFDFSRVLAFPKGERSNQSVSQTYHENAHSNEAFSSFLDLNTEIIDFVSSHPQYPAHIFSASSLQMLQEISGFLIPPFQSFISASHENLPKNNAESYKEIAFRLKIKPSALLFIDDSPYNIAAAQAAGATAILYTSNEAFFSTLRVVLPIS